MKLVAVQFAAFSLGLLVLCPHPGEARNERPAWAAQRPRQEGMIVGIGVADIGGDLVRARQLANEYALQDIAGQLEIQVRSRIEMQVSEGADAIRREYRAEMETEVEQRLRGVEIVDTWEDTEHIWVYARFSLVKYAAKMMGEVEQARALMVQAAKQAKKSTPTALVSYIQAHQLLHGATNDPLWIDEQVASLALEVRAHIQELLNAIELEPVAVVAGPVEDIELQIKLSYRDHEIGKERKANAFPIAFAYVGGNGESAKLAWTDAEGRAKTGLRDLKVPGGRMHVEARFDLAALAPGEEVDLSGFLVPLARFTLQVEMPRVSTVGNGAEAQFTVTIAKEELLRAGFECVDPTAEANASVSIDAQARDAGRLGKIYFAFVALEVAVRQTENNRLLFHMALEPSKGAGRHFAQARRNAAARAGQEFREKALDAILATLRRQEGELLGAVSTATSISSLSNSHKGGEK